MEDQTPKHLKPGNEGVTDRLKDVLKCTRVDPKFLSIHSNL